MKQEQLPLYKHQKQQRLQWSPALEPLQKPSGDSTVMQTLLAYRVYLQERYMPKTAWMYWSDVRALSLHLKDSKLNDITRHV